MTYPLGRYASYNPQPVVPEVCKVCGGTGGKHGAVWYEAVHDWIEIQEGLYFAVGPCDACKGTGEIYPPFDIGIRISVAIFIACAFIELAILVSIFW